MALVDNLTTEKEALTALLESEYPVYNLRDSPLLRLFLIRFLLGELVGSGSGGDASALNQTIVQAVAGSDATKAISIQGITGGKAIPINGSITNTAFTANAGTNLNTSLLAVESGGNLTSINTKLPASLGAKAASASLSVTQAFAATSTLVNVTSSATSVSLLAANNNRKTAIIINDSTSDLYVTLNASAASTTNYSLFLAAKVGNTPSSLILKGDDYSGEIRGIWSSANGFARITEVV